jgi:hypothetical protein
MKRATVFLLVLSLLAVPSFAGTNHKVTSARCVSLERLTGAWRMEIECDSTTGAILMLDTGHNLQFVGLGMFKGWSQSELSALYQSLVPKADSNLVMIQLG